jgi:hypothetical protein
MGGGKLSFPGDRSGLRRVHQLSLVLQSQQYNVSVRVGVQNNELLADNVLA